jgi:hypothetical protein
LRDGIAYDKPLVAFHCTESSDIDALRADPALLLLILALGCRVAIEKRFKDDTKGERANPQNDDTGKYPKPISVWLRMIRHFLSGSLIQEVPERKAQGVHHETEQNQDADNLEHTLGVLVLVGKKVAQLIAIAGFGLFGGTFCGVTHQVSPKVEFLSMPGEV